MADVPISYFKAVRSSGKFQPSNPPDLETPPPVINPPGSGGGVNLFKNLGDVTDRSFLGKNGYVPVVTAENLLSLQPLPQVPDNGLISGGIVQWTGTGYVFNVSSCFYRISGEPYSTDPTQKTLSTPDVTNNRIDVFAVDINSLVVVIEGTPSATPVKPQIDPSTQIELTSVIVTASSTEPTLTEEIIYDENIEWTGTSAGTGTVSFNSAVDPFEGTVSIETTDIQNGFIVKLTNSIDVDISTFQTLGFQLNLKASMPSNQNLYGLFINSVGDAVSNKFLLNFDKSLAGSYQFIGIALNTLSFTSNDIRSIYFSFERLAGSPTYSGFFLDVVRLEGGINPPVNVGSFLNLTDTPNTYLGQSGKSVTVKADESGLEFSTGGGGASSFLALTDTPSAYVGQAGLFPRVNVGETALAFDSVSPYDLDQEGATDGQVLTWVTANSRYEPVTPSGGSSLWTDATTYIYRNSPVVIGDTVWSNSTALTVKGNATASSWVLKVADSSGSNLIALLNDRRLWMYSDIMNFGNNPNGSFGFTLKSYFNSTQNLFDVQDSSGSQLFNILANGQFFFKSDRMQLGVPLSPPLTGISVKVPLTGFAHALRISDSTNAINFNLYANGTIATNTARHGFGITSGIITNGSHFQGAGTGTGEIFVVQNGSAQRAFEIRGNRQILMAGLPTSDPGVVGSLWNDLGDLKISI